jgi:hypothetical protein
MAMVNRGAGRPPKGATAAVNTTKGAVIGQLHTDTWEDAYGRIVWVKTSPTFNWWPAVICSEKDTPQTLESKAKTMKNKKYVVRYYGMPAASAYDFAIPASQIRLFRDCFDTFSVAKVSSKYTQEFALALKEAEASIGEDGFAIKAAKEDTEEESGDEGGASEAESVESDGTNEPGSSDDNKSAADNKELDFLETGEGKDEEIVSSSSDSETESSGSEGGGYRKKRAKGKSSKSKSVPNRSKSTIESDDDDVEAAPDSREKLVSKKRKLPEGKGKEKDKVVKAKGAKRKREETKVPSAPRKKTSTGSKEEAKPLKGKATNSFDELPSAKAAPHLTEARVDIIMKYVK